MTINSKILIVLASHGDLASALLRAAELIAGPQGDVYCLALMPGDDVQAFQSRMAEVVGVDRTALILVDMMGGTPWNIALRVAAQNTQVRVVSGVNLPMLLEVSLARNGMSIDALKTLAQETGAQAVQVGPKGD